MDSPVINRTFFAETLRCMYHIYGYDALMKEIQFIHHLHHSDPVPATQHVPASVPAPQEAAPSQPPTQVMSQYVEEEEQKDVFAHIKPKYVRSEKPDELRCTAVTNNGMRCTLARKRPTAFCHRHRDAVVQEEANSETGSDS